MTIILSYQGPNSLVMLGDLLLSQQTPRTAPIQLPTRFDPRFPLANLNLSGLVQKTICVSPDLAVAWAGNYLVARHVIREIATQWPERYYTGDKILSFINSLGLSQQELESVSFIFWGRSGPGFGKIHVQDWLVKEERSADGREKFKFMGSGDFHFFETIGFKLWGAGQIEEWQNSIGAVVGRASIALYQEITSDVTHNFLYGGGFEVVYPSDSGFRKLPLTFIFWAYDDKGIELVGPVFSHVYDNSGVLGLRRFARGENGWSQTIFPIGNFLVESSSAQFNPRAELNTPWTVHYLLSRSDPQMVKFIQKVGPGNLAVRVEQGQIVPELSPEFIRHVNAVTGLDLSA
jgi:hypothetical protein